MNLPCSMLGVWISRFYRQDAVGLRLVLLLAGLAAPVFCAGCSSDERTDFSLEERRLASAPEPPPVLNVAVIALLTNQPGFGAHARIERGSAVENKKPLEGGLLHRGNEFLFAAEAQDKRARGREMTFIWNWAQNAGYALNDALPGYAPIPPRAQITKLENTGGVPSAEKINGHLCREDQLSVTLTDGSEMQLRVWRASDLNAFPVRIRSDGGSPRFTVDFTDIRLQDPSAGLFEIPHDFAKYETPKAMFDELFRRESVGRRGVKSQRDWDEEALQNQPFGTKRQPY
jgi:hypothetical protein